MNDENLKNGKDTQFQTGEEQAKIARKGGIASGEARRRKRTLRELAELMSEKKVAVPMQDGTTEEMTYDAALIHSQYQKAIARQDTKAATFIAKVLGEIEDKHDVSLNGQIELVPEGLVEVLDKNAK